jgi:hypothetical protein
MTARYSRTESSRARIVTSFFRVSTTIAIVAITEAAPQPRLFGADRRDQCHDQIQSDDERDDRTAGRMRETSAHD